MEILIKTASDELIEDNDYKEFILFVIEWEKVLDMNDWEPEDNNLCRNFSDCYKIKDLIKRAYEVWKKGEELIITEVEINEY